MSDSWQVEPKPVPAELTAQYPHETYPPAAVRFPTIADRLDTATTEQLLALAKATI